MSATAVQTRFRATDLVEAFDRSIIDGTMIVVNDQTGDVLVDDGALRDSRRVLAARAAATGRSTILYSLESGVRALNAPGGPKASLPTGIGDGTAPTVVIDRLRDHLLRSATPYHLQIDWSDHLLPADQLATANGDTARIVEQLADMATNPEVRKGGHVVTLFGRGGALGQQVAQLPGFSVVGVGLPSQFERRAMFELKNLPVESEADDMARATGALRLYDVLMISRHTSPDRPMTKAMVRERAQREFERALQGIARVDTTQVVIGRDLVGLAQLRLILEDYGRDPEMPLRLAFVGPPGTGKSFSARAVATWLGIVLLIPETLEEMWVGSSQRNAVRYRDTAMSLAPSLTFFDDQNNTLTADRQGGGLGDVNGISSSLTGQFLDMFSDPLTPPGLHLIIASNFARQLDTAMNTRVQRVAFLPPDTDELALQLEATARARSWDLEPGVALQALLEHPRRLTSRDAVTILRAARTRMLRSTRSEISSTDLVDALIDYNPGIDAAIERQTLEALEATTFTSHLPWMAARHFGEAATQPPSYLRDFVQADGSLDRDRVTERINELEYQRAR